MAVKVPATARTMTLFEVFAQERRELSNSELARLLNLPESSCSDLLYTLQDAGYLTRTSRTRRYYPTRRLLETAQAIAEHNPQFAVCAEAIELLRDSTGETTISGRLEQGYVQIIGFQESRYELRYVLKVGSKFGLHVSALGKAVLAAIPPAEAARQLRLKPLRKVTPRSITDIPTLERQVEDIRRAGYTLVEGEGAEGVSALAIAGFIGGEAFAICLTGPTERINRNIDDYKRAILELKDQVFAAHADAPPRSNSK